MTVRTRQPPKHETRIRVEYDSTWEEIQEQIKLAGIPPYARFDLFIDRGGNSPVDIGYKEVVLTWTQQT